MSKERFYRRVNSIPVPGKDWDHFGDPKLEPPQAAIAALHRFVVADNGENTTDPQLEQISPKEKRTFVVVIDGLEPFQDEYGNWYGCFDVKGNNANLIEVHRINHAPSGFSYRGLQETDSITRATVASQKMRELKIPTEWGPKIFEPDAIPFQGQMMTQEEFKTALVEDTIARIAAGKHSNRLDLDDIPKLCQSLEGMTFVNSLRAKQVNERVYDLRFATPAAFQKMISRAFDFYNFVFDNDKENRKYSVRVDINNPEDVKNYFRVILPYEIGFNYGTLHKSGLVHTHPHLQNLSLVGGIYDTDTVVGTPLGLGDPEITTEDRVTDMKRLLYGYWIGREGRGLVHFFYDIARSPNFNFLPSTSYFSEAIETSVIRGYVNGRGWSRELLDHLDELDQIITHRDGLFHSLVPRAVLNDLNETGQWKHEIEIEDVGKFTSEVFESKSEWLNLVEQESDEFILELMTALDKTAWDIINSKLVGNYFERFDDITKSHGEKNSFALKNLIARALSIDYAVDQTRQFYDQFSGDESAIRQYILKQIK